MNQNKRYVFAAADKIPMPPFHYFHGLSDGASFAKYKKRATQISGTLDA